MISLFHVIFLGIMSKFGRHVNSAPLDPCNYIRGSNISQHKTCAHCLNTDYPTGLRLYKGPVFAIKIERKQKKKMFCLLLSFSVIFALFELLSWRGIYQFLAAFYKCIPDLCKWMNICLEVSWTACAMPRYICKYCKQTPLLKIGSTKGVAKWVYVKTFLCSAVSKALSGTENRERRNKKCSCCRK